MIKDSSNVVKLLVLSREAAILGTVMLVAEANSWQVEIATDAWDAMDKLHCPTPPNLLVLDLSGNPRTSLQILRVLRRMHPDLPLVLIGNADDLEKRSEAFRLGARHYIFHPLESSLVESTIRQSISAENSGVDIEVAGDPASWTGNGQLDAEQHLTGPRPEERGRTTEMRQTNCGSEAASHQFSGGICGYKSLRLLLQSVKEEAEKNAIALALEKTGWNRKAAARLLKTSYRSVLYKIEQYQMSSAGCSRSPSVAAFEALNGAPERDGSADARREERSGFNHGGLSER